jgi:hypothetical protein
MNEESDFRSLNEIPSKEWDETQLVSFVLEADQAIKHYQRRTLVSYWRAGQAFTFLFARHKKDRDWTAFLKRKKIPVTFAYRARMLYEVATAKGHEEATIEQYESITDALAFYGIRTTPPVEKGVDQNHATPANNQPPVIGHQGEQQQDQGDDCMKDLEGIVRVLKTYSVVPDCALPVLDQLRAELDRLTQSARLSHAA